MAGGDKSPPRAEKAEKAELLRALALRKQRLRLKKVCTACMPFCAAS